MFILWRPSKTVRPVWEVAMPFLDAGALESDPEGLAFLRSILKPDPERRGGYVPLPRPGEPGPGMLDTTVEILVEAAEHQSIMPARASSAS
jgi:hypothetical protein